MNARIEGEGHKGTQQARVVAVLRTNRACVAAKFAMPEWVLETRVGTVDPR